MISKSKLSTKEYWTFRNESNRKFTHGLHLYPARMHPEIAKNIIESYAKDKRKVILDPYVGSAGVLIEAMIHGNNSIGFDINPFAVLLSKVKTSVINPKKAQMEYNRILEKAKHDYKKGKFYPKLVPTDFDVRFWYKPSVIKKLSILKHHILNSNSENKIIDFLKICFSMTARKAGNQRNSEYKIYRMSIDTLENFKPDVFEIFNDICKNNCSLMSDFRDTMRENNAKAIVKCGNALNLSDNLKKINSSILDDSKGLMVITSPPYGDHTTTVAYGQFSYHLGLWLDLPVDLLKNVDKVSLGGQRVMGEDKINLGSRNLINNFKEVMKKDPKRALDVYSFFYDLDISLEEFSKVMSHKLNYLCFVVGNRTVRRIPIKTDKILIELARKYGFKHMSTYSRSIISKVVPVKTSPENISKKVGNTMTEEKIVIFKS